MARQSVVHNTFVIERSYPSSPARVFAAFADPTQKRRWFAESENHDVEMFEMDFRVGGVERSRYRFKEGTMFAGVAMASEGNYHEIEINKRVIIASTMSMADRRISAALVTVEFLPTEQGTDLICTHQAAFLEGSDGPQIREAGWRGLFKRLEKELAR